ncbi:maleylacetoacetate isomerase [Roseateles sp. SL47]|uniref:maleylacetoacetate isomerase n=1 Tax=Roseateles sp. SL47 TaxID=2995138 RepID=UPI00226ED4C5|nr:maleylacetoacetate isomerase [Roseateles sp. SL47]WAC72720.1 maleylacetoacetate isomerase [Roseateles sp. SL47]
MLTLHTYFRSSAAFRVRIALKLKGLAYESIPVHLVRGGGEHHQATFKALNPSELLPVLQTEGRVLTQSLSILEFLEERYPQPPLLPGSAEDRAFIRSLALDVACEIHPVNNLRVLQHLTASFGASDDQRRAWVQHWIQLGFASIEQRLPQNASGFCVGDQATMADVVLVPQVFNALRFGVALDAYPRIERVWTHCMALPAFEAASPGRQGDAE